MKVHSYQAFAAHSYAMYSYTMYSLHNEVVTLVAHHSTTMMETTQCTCIIVQLLHNVLVVINPSFTAPFTHHRENKT